MSVLSFWTCISLPLRFATQSCISHANRLWKDYSNVYDCIGGVYSATNYPTCYNYFTDRGCCSNWLSWEYSYFNCLQTAYSNCFDFTGKLSWRAGMTSNHGILMVYISIRFERVKPPSLLHRRSFDRAKLCCSKDYGTFRPKSCPSNRIVYNANSNATPLFDPGICWYRHSPARLLHNSGFCSS